MIQPVFLYSFQHLTGVFAHESGYVFFISLQFNLIFDSNDWDFFLRVICHIGVSVIWLLKYVIKYKYKH